MKNLRLAAVAALVSGFAMFAAAPAQASAYPDVVVVLTADSPVVGGKTVNFSVTTTAGTIDCAWTVTWSDGVASGESDVRTSSGRTTSFSGSFESKVVPSSTPTTMTAECVYDDAQIASADSAKASVAAGSSVTPAIYSAGTGSTLQAIDQDATPDSVTVTLLPTSGVGGEGEGDGDGDGDGALPDTGGSNLSWLLIGGALVLAGGGVTYAARRRQSAR